MAARHRRIAIAITSVLIAVPAGVGLVGCSAVEKALDCVQTADAIAESVTDLQQAIDTAGNDPTQADEALDDIDKNIDEIGDKTDNADVTKAVDHLEKSVDNVRESIDKGDATPDLSPVVDAAGELTKVCTP
jgi:peptidoglycan hydrolase CwlO-like protein